MTAPALRLRAHLGPIDARLQLGTPPDPAVRSALIAWESTPEPVDAGVPGPVAHVLAAGLAEAGRVAFLRSTAPFAGSTDWTAVGADSVRDAGAPGVLARLAQAAHAAPARFALVATREPATIVASFEDPGFPWWLQGQVLLLSDPRAGPPDITPERARACCGEGAWAHVDALRAAGIVVLARPGVDGAVIGVHALVPSRLAGVLEALSRAAGVAGAGWDVVD